MPLNCLCRFLLLGLSEKSKMRSCLGYRNLSQTLAIHMQTSSIPGTFGGEIIVMACFSLFWLHLYWWSTLGALVMYQQSEQLTSAPNDSKSFTRAELSLEAMMIAINALSMLASNNAWIIVPRSLVWNSISFIPNVACSLLFSGSITKRVCWLRLSRWFFAAKIWFWHSSSLRHAK